MDDMVRGCMPGCANAEAEVEACAPPLESGLSFIPPTFVVVVLVVVLGAAVVVVVPGRGGSASPSKDWASLTRSATNDSRLRLSAPLFDGADAGSCAPPSASSDTPTLALRLC